MRTVLIVDDEKNIVDILKYNLRKEYTILEAYDGEEALERYREGKPDLILLDVMLPKLDGFEVCRRIRETDNHTPIIMITAREEETDKVMGLDAGADDYITKPFTAGIRELQARVRANIRRMSDSADAPPPTPGLFIDVDRMDVFINGNAAELTPREFELLQYLAASPGTVFSREELLRDVWQYDYYGDLRTVDVAVKRLREKIEENSAEPKYVRTKRGFGYYFEGV